MPRIAGRLPLEAALVWLAIIGHFALPGRSAAEQWADCRVVGPFVCRADFSLRHLDHLLDQLAQLQAELVENLGIRPASEPIQLYLFRDNQSYRRYLRQYLPQVPYRHALYVKDGGPGKVLVHVNRDFEIDLRHECTHALLHSDLPVVPLWLDEGLAEYFEVPPAKRAFDNPHLKSVKWSTRLGIVPRLGRLEKIGDFAKMGRAEYRDSWAWVHFMLHGPAEAHDELARFLGDIQASTPPGLLSQRLFRRIPNVKSRFLAHFRRWKR